MRRLKVILATAVIAAAWSQTDADGKEATVRPNRTLVYAYNEFVLTITVKVTETESGATGEVVAVRVPPPQGTRHGVFHVSKAEFDQMWSTLTAPGVEKRLLSGTQADLANEYLFQAGNQSYALKKISSAPAVSALASRLRNHADAALKGRPIIPAPQSRNG